MERDDKRRFSGLSDLISDTRSVPEAQPRQTSPRPSAPEKPVFALLELKKWPTLPAPWSSVDAGETWVWGDFFLTFHKKPKAVLDLTMEMQGKKAEYRGMTYHYAMSVFYRIDRNSHGLSHRPIMTFALEQADMGMLAKMLGSEAGDLLQAEGGSKMGPLMIGLFTGETRLNLGEYGGNISPKSVKRRFFEILGAVERKRPTKDDRRSGAGSRPPRNGAARQKEKLWMCVGVSLLHWHWRPGRLGADVYMRELGMKFQCEPEEVHAHGW